MSEPTKRSRLVLTLVVLVVLLASCNIFMLVQSGIVGKALSGAWSAVTRAEGVRLLLNQLNLGTTPEEAALQWASQGAEYLEAGDHRKALATFSRAVEFAPGRAVGYVGLASVYEAMGDRDQAIVQLELAVEAEPSNAEAHRHLGRLHCLIGDFAVCVEELERSVDLEPNNIWGHFFLGMAYQGDSEQGFGKSEAAYQEVLRLDPKFGGAHLGLGYLYSNRPGKEALALEQFKRALDVAVEVGDEKLAAQARSELAELYYADDNFTKCIEELKRVLDQEPENADAHRRIGLCYALRGGVGDLEIAVAELDRALAQEFADVDLYYLYLGEYLAKEGDPAGAAAAWRQFLRFSNDEDVKAQVRSKIEQLDE